MKFSKSFFLPIKQSHVAEAVTVGIGQIFAAIGSIVTIKVLTEFLSPSEYGELALGLTASVLVSQVVLGPLSQACLRHFSVAREEGQIGEYIRAFFWIVLRILGAGLVLTLIIIPLVNIFSGGWLILVLGSISYAFIQGLNGVLDNIQNAARRRTTVAFHVGGAVWLRLIIAVIIIAQFGATSEAAISGYLLGAIVILASELLFLRRNIVTTNLITKSSDEAGSLWRKRIFDYAWPFATWGIFTFIQQTSDRWSLGIIMDASDVGLYTALYQMSAYPILFFSGIVTQVFEPVIYMRAGDGTQEERLRFADQFNKWLVIGSLGLTALFAGVAWVISKYIFQIFVGREYQSVYYLMPLMIIAGGFFVAGQMSTLFLTTRKQTSSLITPKVVTAMVGVALNLVGAILFGIAGIVYAQIIYSFIYLVWILKIVRDHVRVGI
jgi:O-antigen/teichoic acid export membrane protein